MANVLPARAIRFDSEGAAFVYLIDGDNTVRTVDVVLGQDDGEEIEVIAGLEAGQMVIGPHLDRFNEGQQVEPL